MKTIIQLFDESVTKYKDKPFLWEKTDAENSMDMENTGMTFVPVKSFEASVASTPTTCQMKRPS